VIATDPAFHPKLQSLFASWFGANFDALLAWFGMAPRNAGGAGAEVVCALLGVIVVLVAGSIWRRRKLQQVKHATQ